VPWAPASATEAVKIDPERWALALLGAGAGLRQREIIALERGDVDLVAGSADCSALVLAGHRGHAQSGRERNQWLPTFGAAPASNEHAFRLFWVFLLFLWTNGPSPSSSSNSSLGRLPLVSCTHRRLWRMREDRLRPLMEAFGKIVADHEVSRELLGFI
jgi:hypothetical protein